MNGKVRAVIVAVMVLFFAFGACVHSSFASVDGGMKIVTLSTNKDVYHPNEEMDVFLSIYSTENLSEVLVTVSGLTNRYGAHFVSFSRKTDLIAGMNDITFTRYLPSCSSCAGLSLGAYFINATVVYDDDGLTASHGIALTQYGTITYVNIATDELERMIASGEITLLDVRTEDEYNTAHIEGARVIPVSDLDNRTDDLNKSKKIVVYSGYDNNSTIACNMLIADGFERVYNVLGGIVAWEERGCPVVSEHL